MFRILCVFVFLYGLCYGNDLVCNIPKYNKKDFADTSGNARSATKEERALAMVTDSINSMRLGGTPSNATNIEELVELASHSSIAKLYVYHIYALSNKSCLMCRELVDNDFSYLNDRAIVANFLDTESYALQGELRVCEGLKNKDSNMLVEAYAYLALSGLNTRAINALLQAAYLDNRGAVALLTFLLDNGIYLSQSRVGASMLNNAFHKNSATNALKTNPTIKKQLFVTEFGAKTDVYENLEYLLLIQDGRILAFSDNRYGNLGFSLRQDIVKSVRDTFSITKEAKQRLINAATKSEKEKYRKIFEFKEKLYKQSMNNKCAKQFEVPDAAMVK